MKRLLVAVAIAAVLLGPGCGRSTTSPSTVRPGSNRRHLHRRPACA